MISEDPWQKNYKPEEAASSEVCHFYQAASLHRHHVLRELLPKHELVVI